MNISPEKANAWFQAKGEERDQAVQEAADIILSQYRSHPRWRHIIPIELHRLAATLNIKIVPIDNMDGEALLVPAKDGFHIYVKDNFYRTGRYRLSVAHELAHTLFYVFNKDEPRRIIEPSEREEWFCFDVARRILAPQWHLESLGITCKSEPQNIFDSFTKKLQISRPVAARIMLQDYRLVQGVAGRWERNGRNWTLKKGVAYASPTLKRTQREKLREKAFQFIEKGIEPDPKHRILSFFEKSGSAVFLVVAKVA